MILLIDNYDSFTYNLFQYLSELGAQVEVVRNNKITISEIAKMGPEKIVISPGPGYPDGAGISVEVVREFGGKVPLLGVCLGHQCIGQAYGGKIVHAGELRHGKTSEIFHEDTGVFKGLPNPFAAVRYHSLAVDAATVPECLEVTAKTENGLIMGLRHKIQAVEGVQFHPESIMTGEGKHLLKNFLKIGS